VNITSVFGHMILLKSLKTVVLTHIFMDTRIRILLWIESLIEQHFYFVTIKKLTKFTYLPNKSKSVYFSDPKN